MAMKTTMMRTTQTLRGTATPSTSDSTFELQTPAGARKTTPTRLSSAEKPGTVTDESNSTETEAVSEVGTESRKDYKGVIIGKRVDVSCIEAIALTASSTIDINTQWVKPIYG